MRTQCTQRSNVITLKDNGAIERRFLKNEQLREAISDFEVVNVFDVVSNYTCPIVRYDLVDGDDDTGIWYGWNFYDDYEDLFWFND